MNKNVRKVFDVEGIENLNPKELDYFRAMYANHGVLYITDRPGMGKTATIYSIANKLGFQLIDKRLSQIDETEVGLFPDKTEYKGHKCLDHVVPKWAYMANERPTIVVFDELNRAQLAQRNAALQIFNERRIGEDFFFNDNVFFVATGNLGGADKCDVEEFDAALVSRLIWVKHNLSLVDWIEYYAKENVNPHIVSFLKAKNNHFFQNNNDNEEAFACARSWTNLSFYIESGYKNPNNVNEWLEDIKLKAHRYVGTSSAPFYNYLEETMKISIKQIIDNYDKYESILAEASPSKIIELTDDLRAGINKISGYKKEQRENIIKFITILGDEAKTGVLFNMIDACAIKSESETGKGDGDSDKVIAEKKKLKETIMPILKHENFKHVVTIIKQTSSQPPKPQETEENKKAEAVDTESI